MEVLVEHKYAIKLAFKTTNNKVEYEALLVELKVTKWLGAMKVEVKAGNSFQPSWCAKSATIFSIFVFNKC